MQWIRARFRDLLTIIGLVAMFLSLVVGAFLIFLTITSLENQLIAVTLLLMYVSALIVGLRSVGQQLPHLFMATVPRAKSKRGTDNNTDEARLGVLLALMTPDERDELKAHLVDDIRVEDDMLPLADLLDQQNGAKK